MQVVCQKLFAAAMTGVTFAQLYGDTVKDYREAMEGESDELVKGMAFLSGAGTGTGAGGDRERVLFWRIETDDAQSGETDRRECCAGSD